METGGLCEYYTTSGVTQESEGMHRKVLVISFLAFKEMSLSSNNKDITV